MFSVFHGAPHVKWIPLLSFPPETSRLTNQIASLSHKLCLVFGRPARDSRLDWAIGASVAAVINPFVQDRIGIGIEIGVGSYCRV